jgi:F0F1-type ATP synthase assembly protein I
VVSSIRLVLLWQSAVLSVAVAATAFWGDQQAGYALLYGGGLAMLNTLLLWRRVARMQRSMAAQAQSDVASLYIGAVERFAVTLVLLGLGLGWLGLNPPWLLGGFALGYLAMPLARSRSRSG